MHAVCTSPFYAAVLSLMYMKISLVISHLRSYRLLRLLVAVSVALGLLLGALSLCLGVLVLVASTEKRNTKQSESTMGVTSQYGQSEPNGCGIGHGTQAVDQILKKRIDMYSRRGASRYSCVDVRTSATKKEQEPNTTTVNTRSDGKGAAGACAE